ncbi:hypothetical protein [Streptomyces sp. 7N604]|uniref:hypothetical protein n=1 Tax=Streptomyces sp. 7N604 TaxID=3457415 RepID=UPI003FD6B43C
MGDRRDWRGRLRPAAARDPGAAEAVGTLLYAVIALPFALAGAVLVPAGLLVGARCR